MKTPTTCYYCGQVHPVNVAECPPITEPLAPKPPDDIDRIADDFCNRWGNPSTGYGVRKRDSFKHDLVEVLREFRKQEELEAAELVLSFSVEKVLEAVELEKTRLRERIEIFTKRSSYNWSDTPGYSEEDFRFEGQIAMANMVLRLLQPAEGKTT